MAAHVRLHDAFADELREAQDAGKQLLQALPTLAAAATSAPLRAALQHRIAATERQLARLDGVLAATAVTERRRRCDGIAGILAEAVALVDAGVDDATRDASLIASGRRVEHYEMAAFGTLAAWARTIGHEDVAAVLDDLRAESQAADDTLTALGDGGIHAAAARVAPESVSPSMSGSAVPAATGRP